MITHNTVQTGDLQLQDAEASGTGPPSVLLHGITGSFQAFPPLMPEPAETAHVYALDLRGHGFSGRAPTAGTYRVPGFSPGVQGFLRTMVDGPAAWSVTRLAGWSPPGRRRTAR